MNNTLNILTSLLMTLILGLSDSVWATSIQVTALGNAGWDSGDTRAAGYLDIHGDNQLVSGRTATEDALISQRIGFVASPDSTPLNNGSLHLSTPASDDKATVQNNIASPFTSNDINMEYSWYKSTETTPTTAAPALKILLDTTEVNPNDAQAQEKGETVGDKILVYEPYRNHTAIDDLWTTETITQSDGLWWLVNLNGTNSSLMATDNSNLKTLDGWLNEFSNAGLVGSNISSIQLGVGSGSPGLDSYVDYLSFTNAGDTQTWDFAVATVPVPAAVWLFGSGLLGLVGVARRKKA